jgi:hypothetical protein
MANIMNTDFIKVCILDLAIAHVIPYVKKILESSSILSTHRRGIGYNGIKTWKSYNETKCVEYLQAFCTELYTIVPCFSKF